MFYVAAGERYLDINEVTKTPVDEFFTFMNFYKRKCELDNQRIRASTKH
jgi:hypothetical protein